ncbi:EAL domain-containing protein [Noviherbaspirillum malthae]|jgi:diguanylate cyclase (GGDEF)-like protein|uniref:EAL domain-containing protein n=1 Tax=Noviherbaspirillum malthae TaxID=1260987 RepID=UPI00188FCF00|nr:EAL domain-containing protein [Noviherbaspirillum malthae]
MSINRYPVESLIPNLAPKSEFGIREQFSFKFSELLVSSYGFDDTITKIIELVCRTFGWEWGAYWAPDHGFSDRLVCRHYWHSFNNDLSTFAIESTRISIPAHQGFVGRIWGNNSSAWIEDMGDDYAFLRRQGAKACGLMCGYALPVSYTAPDGGQNRLGVLEFYSVVKRQQDAQLPTVANAVGVLVALTVRRIEQEEAMRRMAQIDDLTGLVNRAYFRELFDEACRKAADSQSELAVLYIDLDRFKPINDAFGHDAGNVVLREFGARLRRLAGSNVTARLGGDEFCLLVTATVSEQTLRGLAESVLKAAHDPFHFLGIELVVSASVGISRYPTDGLRPEELLRKADEAMYECKRHQRNGFKFHALHMETTGKLAENKLNEPMQFAVLLRQALLKNELFLQYQPIIDLETGNIAAAEALVRWRLPTGEVVMPDRFIPVAEKEGIVNAIDRWVFRRACADLAQIVEAGLPEFRLHVNMAASNFSDTGVCEELMSIAKAFGIAPSQLCLELTERTIMEHEQSTLVTMQALSVAGFNISLDDFGVGYSSMARLSQLPVRSFKIDRSFVNGLPDNQRHASIVKSLLLLAEDLQISAVAEGVESLVQLNWISKTGVRYVQGFYCGHPCEMNRFMSKLHDQAHLTMPCAGIA